ncbi:interleukin-22-like [Sarcophilus harrisii]
METRQGLLKSFFPIKTLALCFLLMTLLAQGGEGASKCKIARSIFQARHINNQIYYLSKMASDADDDTTTRFIGRLIVKDVEETNRCYVMKEVLNFQLREVLLSYEQKYEKYMRDVLPFLNNVKSKLSSCTMNGDTSKVRRTIDDMRSKVKKLGKHAVVKAMSEMDLMLLYLQGYCS